jgi:hypothetical protein
MNIRLSEKFFASLTTYYIWRRTGLFRVCIYTEWHYRKTLTYIDASSGIRTHDPSLQVAKNHALCRATTVTEDQLLRRFTITRGAGVAQSVECLATDWTTGRPGFDPRQGQEIFPVASVSRPALLPTQPSIQWVPGFLSPGVKRGRGVTLTTHPI